MDTGTQNPQPLWIQPRTQFNNLKQYRKEIREISKKRTSQKKRLEIQQKGGFLASLLIPIIGSLAGAIISNTKRGKRK